MALIHRSEDNNFLTFSDDFLYSSHCQSTSFCSSSLSGLVTSGSFSQNIATYLVNPRSLCVPFLSDASGISNIAVILASSGSIPLAEILWPRQRCQFLKIKCRWNANSVSQPASSSIDNLNSIHMLQLLAHIRLSSFQLEWQPVFIWLLSCVE